MQKIFLAMRALPWEKLTIQDGPANPDGTKKVVTAHGDHNNAGFLPVYWDEEAAKAANPGSEVKEAAVGDDWAHRPPLPKNGKHPPQGDQKRLEFEGLDKKGLLSKITEFEKDLGEKGMDSIVKAVRGFVLGSKPLSKAGKDKLQNYVTALSKVSETRPS